MNEAQSAGMIRICDVHKSYGENKVLSGVSLDVPKGQVVAILGRSGCGKSTLLRCVNHLEEPTSGRIYLDNALIGGSEKHGLVQRLNQNDVARQRRQIGMVFQSFNLFPHMTVLQNVIAAPVAVLRHPPEQASDEARALLRRVGLQGKESAYPGQLSGGQQQRVAIARALAMKPRVMLFDEPTSSLDPEMTQEVLQVITSLAAEGMTMLVVTHEMRFARHVAHRVVLMHGGEIAEDTGPTEFFDAPRSDAARAFRGIGAGS
jgi:ABC-type polar amino acid transport system ATPase subunit